MAEYILEIKDLHKKYDQGKSTEVYALRGLDLTVNKGEMIAIMGPSGCGKSTLLNILSSIEDITEGQVIIGGEDLSQATETELVHTRRYNTSIVFQDFNLLTYLTALENVIFPMMLV